MKIVNVHYVRNAKEEVIVDNIGRFFKVENNSFELTRIFKESFIDQRSIKLTFILTLTFGQ